MTKRNAFVIELKISLILVDGYIGLCTSGKHNYFTYQTFSPQIPILLQEVCFFKKRKYNLIA